jgi:hypothetical protein
MPNNESIRRSLTREVEGARERFKAEAENLKTVAENLPSLIPYPDSVMTIHLSAQAYHDALVAYKAALKRLNDYTLHGIVPDDLKGLAETE